MHRRILFFLALFAVILTSGFDITYDGKTVKYTTAPIRLFVENIELTNLEMPPVVYNQYILVPAKEAFELLGVVVDWKASTNEIYMSHDNHLLVMAINSTKALLNGQTKEALVTPKIMNDKVMVPMSFVAESLGLGVSWDQSQRIARLSLNSLPTPTPLPTPVPTPVQTATPVPTQVPTYTFSPPLELSPTPPPELGYVYQPPNAMQPPAVTTPIPEPVPMEPIEKILDSKTDVIPSDNPYEIPDETEQKPLEEGQFYIVDKSTQIITEEKRLETTITDIYGPSNIYQQVYLINSNSPMQYVSYFVLFNKKLVVDIKNAQFALPKNEYLMPNSPVISKIRASQFAAAPVKVTRIVFDIQNHTDFMVYLSEDRQTLAVDFGYVEQNLISDVVFETTSENDFIHIKCSTDAVGEMSVLTNPDRVVFDLKLTSVLAQINKEVPGRFAQSIRSANLDEHTIRITIDLKKIADFELINKDGTATIKLSAPTYKSLWYDSTAKTIRIHKFNGLKASDIVHTDNYLRGNYTLTLPGDYSAHLGFGSLNMNDDYLSEVVIQNNPQGKTDLVIKQKRILAYVLTEDDNYIYIKSVMPKEKYSKIVIIDAGHGGSDPGTDGNGLVEKDVNLDNALRLIKIFDADPNIKAYATRLTDVYPDLGDRVEMANIGDLFVSVHVNSGDKNYKAHGIETFYYPHDNDSTIGISNKAFADIVHKNVLAATGALDRKVKNDSIYVVKYSDVPAILVEFGFITNVEEAAKMADPNYRQTFVQGIYQGILETFKVYTPKR